MQILGDQSAVLKDLTIVSEATLMDRKRELYPLITSDLEAADQAYVKIPWQTHVPFPTQFDGEGDEASTEVAVVQEYNMATYMLKLTFGSDLLRESKAYNLAMKVQEGTLSAKMFPSYNMTQIMTQNAGNVTQNVASGMVAFDAKQFYVPANAGVGAGAHYWPGGKVGTYSIVNSIPATGQNLTQLWADLQSAVAQIMTFKDNQGHLLNPQLEWGVGDLLIHCPVALKAPFTQLLHSGYFPTAAPVTGSGTAAASASGPMTIQQFNGVADLFADGYLDTQSTTRWYLHYVGQPQRPFTWGQSYGLQGRALGPGSEYDTRTNKSQIVLKQRFLQGAYRVDRSIRIG